MDRSFLKNIALISMVIDHIGAIIVYPLTANNELLFWAYILMRIIGRLSFPIFAFLLAEGFKHTGNFKKYLSRILIFAAISEIPYNLAFGSSFFLPYRQNVLWTFALGLIMLYLLDKFRDRKGISVGVIVLCMIISNFFHLGLYGISLVLFMYIFRERRKLPVGIPIVINAAQNGFIQIFSLFSLLFISRYNGEKGRSSSMFFYWFYPVHLIILCLI